MTPLQSTRFAAIATAIAVVLGGTAIALAVHANSPSSADLPGISTTRSHSTALLQSPVVSIEPTPAPASDTTSVAPAAGPKSPPSATKPAPSASRPNVQPPSTSVQVPDPAHSDEEDEHEVITPEIREDDHDSDEDVDPPESSSETPSALEKDSE